MDCKKDTFSIFIVRSKFEVDAVCEDKNIKFCVHLPKRDVLSEMVWGKENEIEHLRGWQGSN